MNTAQNLTLEATLAQSQAPTSTDKAEIWLDWLTWLGRILLLCILVITPWEFGAVDPWAQRQIAIVIGICLAIWWFETALRRTRTQVLPYVFVPIALGILLAMFQLWELPSWLSSILGRQSELYQQLGADLKLSPTISMSHEGTRYFMGLVTLAISGLVLGCRYFRTRFEVTLLLTAMAANGALISFFGIIHSLTSQDGFIYWTIELVNGGAPFGPYVNRNNGAGFLLICMACSIGLMVILMANKEERGPRQIVSKEIPFWRQFMFHLSLFLSDLNARKTASIVATILIGIGIIATLSRGGVLALLVGLAITLIFYGMARRPSFTGFIFLPMVALAFGIAGWVGFSDLLLERFDRFTIETNGTNRLGHWQETWPAVSDMGLLGSGLGSYEHVHRLYRTTPENTIFTFAESQYFQTLVEMGWPGLVLLVGCWGLVYYYSAFSLWRGRSPVTIAISTMGIFLCVSVMVASSLDFGLYQSANMIAMAVVTGALAYNAHALAGRLKEKSWLRFQFPNSYAQVIGLILFSGVFVAGLELHNRARIDSKRTVSPKQFTATQPDLQTTERLISELRPLVRRAPISRGLNYLSLLYVHRMRLQHLEKLLSDSGAPEKMLEDQKLAYANNLWALTSPENVHQNIYSLQRESSVLGARAYQQQDFIQENIRHAINALNLSRRSSLLQPSQQIRLTRLYAIVGATDKASKHAAIAAELAPGSLTIHKLAGIFQLQSGNSDQAAPFIRRYLELDPRRYKEMAELISGSTARKISQPSDKAILDNFLPDDASMIYRYVMENMPPLSATRKEGLEKADHLLIDVSPADHPNMVLSAQIKLALGHTDEAIKRFKGSLVSDPSDFAVQRQIITLLNSQGKYRESIGRLEDLIETDYANRKKYERLLRETRALAKEKAKEK